MIRHISFAVVFLILSFAQLGAAQTRREAAPLLPPGQEAYRAYQKEARELLDAELKLFFPGCVDQKGGGFHEGRVTGNMPPRFAGASLVFQSRMTWAAAEVARRRPEKADEYTAYARHGAKFLQEVMWDKANGGFYWAVDSSGRPAIPTGAQKHAYGMAFAIRALANVYAATGDGQYLKLAQEADAWLAQRGHDKKRGGYFQAFTPGGEIIADSSQTGQRLVKVDKIGTRYGCKSTDAHIHLMEAFTELYRASPDPELRERIQEMFDVTRDKALLATGLLGKSFVPNWTPLDRGGAYGLNVEAAVLVLDAAKVLGTDRDPKVLGLARKLVDTALDYGWDSESGGFWSDPEAKEKQWWAQAQGARALLTLYALSGAQGEPYWTAFQQQWRFISRYMTDQQSRGWFPAVDAAGRPTSRNMIQPMKACDQTVLALIDVSDVLGTLAGDPPPTPTTAPATRPATRPTSKPAQ